jgi:hypothetical protein
MIQSEASQEAEGAHAREIISVLSQTNQNKECANESTNKRSQFASPTEAEQAVSQLFSFKNPIFIRHCVLLI